MVLSVGVGIFQNLKVVGKDCKKKKKKGHCVGMPFDSLKTLYEKRLLKKKKKTSANI